MARTALTLALAISTLAAPALAGAADRTCAPGSPAAAARSLYGGELVSTGEIAGMRTALALEPRIHPGTRRRMLQTPSGEWCDAAAGFNRAFRGSAHEAAAAYARVAAAPYFDGVTVESVERTAPGLYSVRTHARTNGIDATWVVAADASGVRTATWRATAFAQQPLVGQIEGLTALPGGTETYTRGTDGLLVSQRGLPTAESARAAAASEPSVPAVYTGPDGAQIRLSVGDSRVAADPGVRTGVRPADFQQEFMEAIKLNYEEFYSWGLRKGWESDLDPVLGANVGWIYVNDALTLYCQACVFIANDFQIHMLSEFTQFLTALGFTGYTDEKKAFQTVLGHEMFHNFQNAYNNPGPLGRSAGRTSSTAYSEGTARFQETLHSYSDVSFAPKTLVTGGQTNPPGLSLDANHCNGYGKTQAEFAAGPFPKTYNACYFWTSWFNQNGGQAFVRLLTEGIPAHSAKANEEEGVRALATTLPDVPVADQLAFFAHAALTGENQTIAPLSGGGAARDWGSFFFDWTPATLARGAQASQSIAAGGVFGRRLSASATVSLTGTGLALYVVRSDALASSTTPVTGSVAVTPQPGESVWVVAVNPTIAPVAAVLKAT